MNIEIEKGQSHLTHHPMYDKLHNLENIRTFMQHHIFAVWDFMSLLKALQVKLTCTSIPWVESPYDAEVVRLINEIVLGEESDLDREGKASSHYSLYLKGMREIGAKTEPIENFVKNLDLNLLPQELKEIVGFHLDIAMNSEPHEIAASFFYGREKLIPEMFESIVRVLKQHNMNCPTLIYYLERHIELDGDEHGPMGLKCMQKLMDTPEKRVQAMRVAEQSLKMRHRLWDFIDQELN